MHGVNNNIENTFDSINQAFNNSNNSVAGNNNGYSLPKPHPQLQPPLKFQILLLLLLVN